MVDHTFLFSGPVTKIRELVDSGALGALYYFDSTRVNLGLFQHDVNVIWDLAPHDLSIMDHIILEKPEAVVATGGKHLNGLADVAFITIYFPSNVIAHVNVNWLSPVKVRTTLIGGEQKMLVWNDLDADEKIKVYDKGVQISNKEGLHELLVSYRSGDVWAPKVEQTEALKVELEYFIDCIANDRTARQRRRGRLAGRQAARSRRPVAERKRQPCCPLNREGTGTLPPAPIPFLDLVTPHLELEEELVSVFRGALRTAGFVGGPAVEAFEREFAEFCDVRHARRRGERHGRAVFALHGRGREAGRHGRHRAEHVHRDDRGDLARQGRSRISSTSTSAPTPWIPCRLRRYLETDCTRGSQTAGA